MNYKLTVYFILLLIVTHGFVGFAYGQSGCEQANWGSPLESTLKVTSPFNPNLPKNHYGVGYRAADGDNVRAVADGAIIEIGFDFKREINRLGQMGKGWGRYVVIKHADGSTTQYAHLQKNSTNHLMWEPITKGTIIGKADSTGGVSGPHLHFEYTPDGRWKNKSSKKDPHPCLVSCPTPVPLTISGTETITRNSSAQYTASGCPSNVEWSVSGTGATISSTGLLTVGATACGTLTITATCSACGTSATQYVRVTDAEQWVLINTITSCTNASSRSVTKISGNTKYIDYLITTANCPAGDCPNNRCLLLCICPTNGLCYTVATGWTCGGGSLDNLCVYRTKREIYNWDCP